MSFEKPLPTPPSLNAGFIALNIGVAPCVGEVEERGLKIGFIPRLSGGKPAYLFKVSGQF